MAISSQCKSLRCRIQCGFLTNIVNHARYREERKVKEILAEGIGQKM